MPHYEADSSTSEGGKAVGRVGTGWGDGLRQGGKGVRKCETEWDRQQWGRWNIIDKMYLRACSLTYLDPVLEIGKQRCRRNRVEAVVVREAPAGTREPTHI